MYDFPSETIKLSNKWMIGRRSFPFEMVPFTEDVFIVTKVSFEQ